VLPLSQTPEIPLAWRWECAMAAENTTGDAGYLTENDSLMWTIESDPHLRSTTVGVIVLKKVPDWDEVVARMERVTHSVPILRQRVVNPPLHPRTQRWVWDTEFDLSYHLRRVRLPDPGGFDDLLEMAATISEGAFDRARPLWEFTLVEGLHDVEGAKSEAAALVTKVHHVVSDGIGAVQLFAHLFDFEKDPDGSAIPAVPQGIDEVVPSSLELWLDALGRDTSNLVDASRNTARGVLPTLGRAVRDPRGVFHDVSELVASVGRTVAPVRERLSPVMTDRNMARRFDVLEVPFADLRAAAKAADGKLNDAFLAGITGGLRRYHEKHGASVDELRVAMPISLRTADHEAGGNHVTVMRFKVPIGEEPSDQIQDLHEVGAKIRAEKSIPHTETIAGVLNLMPSGVLGSMMKRMDFLASNVPGIDIPMYLAGAKVLQFYPYGPTAGSAVNITLMSYNRTCAMGVNIDTGAIPDGDEFMACLKAGFDDVLALHEG